MSTTIHKQLDILAEAVSQLRREVAEVKREQWRTTSPVDQELKQSTARPKEGPSDHGVKYATIFPAKNGFSIRVTYMNDTFKNYVSGADHEELAATMLAAIYGCEEPQ